MIPVIEATTASLIPELTTVYSKLSHEEISLILKHLTQELLERTKHQINSKKVGAFSKQTLKVGQPFNPYKSPGKRWFLKKIHNNPSFTKSMLKQLELMAFYSQLKGGVWITGKNLAEKLDLHKNTISKNIQYLLKNKIIEECKVHVNGKSHDGYRFLWHEMYTQKRKVTVTPSVTRPSMGIASQTLKNTEDNTPKKESKKHLTIELTKEINYRTNNSSRLSTLNIDDCSSIQNPLSRKYTIVKKSLRDHKEEKTFWIFEGLTDSLLKNWISEFPTLANTIKETLIFGYKCIAQYKKKSHVEDALSYLYGIIKNHEGNPTNRDIYAHEGSLKKPVVSKPKKAIINKRMSIQNTTQSIDNTFGILESLGLHGNVLQYCHGIGLHDFWLATHMKGLEPPEIKHNLEVSYYQYKRMGREIDNPSAYLARSVKLSPKGILKTPKEYKSEFQIEKEAKEATELAKQQRETQQVLQAKKEALIEKREDINNQHLAKYLEFINNPSSLDKLFGSEKSKSRAFEKGIIKFNYLEMLFSTYLEQQGIPTGLFSEINETLNKPLLAQKSRDVLLAFHDKLTKKAKKDNALTEKKTTSIKKAETDFQKLLNKVKNDPNFDPDGGEKFPELETLFLREDNPEFDRIFQDLTEKENQRIKKILGDYDEGKS